MDSNAAAPVNSLFTQSRRSRGLRGAAMAVARSSRNKLIAALLLFAAGPLCGAAALGTLSADRLRNGGYLWSQGADGPVRIVVSRSQQRAYVYRGDELVAVSTVSTGKPGHRTPVGEFTILQKAVHHRSNTYSNAPMPFMQRLTWDGVALHAGSLPGYAASHGCIRLPLAFARKLFAATELGAIVEVIDGEPSALPRVEMASTAEPAQRAVPPAELASATIPAPAEPVAPLFVATPPARARPRPRLQLASAQRIRPPRASWREQSADDFVTWGSAAGAGWAPAGTE